MRLRLPMALLVAFGFPGLSARTPASPPGRSSPTRPHGANFYRGPRKGSALSTGFTPYFMLKMRGEMVRNPSR